MNAPVSISKSVTRAFRVLAEFREAKVPLTALAVAKRLGDPTTSVFAVLKHLTALGLLSFDARHREYFPTGALYELGSWLQDSLLTSEPLQALVEHICAETLEDTALTARHLIFNNIILVRSLDRASASRLRPGTGVGLTLCNSAVGRVILGQLSDTEIRRIWGQQLNWARSSHGVIAPDFDELMAAIRALRSRGYEVAYDCWLEGVGAIAYPVRSALTGCPLAISVTGPSERIRQREAELRTIISAALGSIASGENP